MIGEGVHDGQCGVDLEPADDRQLLVDDRVEPGPVAADDSGLPGRGGALVETHRLDPLRPAGVLGPEVLIELEQRPPFRDLLRRDVALRQPTGREQFPQELRVGLVGLGPPFRAAQRGRFRRLG
ncbi:hypothetical protein ACIA5C_48540 [Actinoplanes sp. NPDC051343]|uniref:hypothetical protein n=1 Tax=Actinoplanes sp. NPDC051343 TaxID=3363906 RepID=UPI0037B57702